MATIANRAADETLVLPCAVRCRRVEKRHAQLQRPMDGPNRLVLVAWPVALGHAHAPETNCRNRQAARAQLPKLHASSRYHDRSCRVGLFWIRSDLDFPPEVPPRYHCRDFSFATIGAFTTETRQHRADRKES